jgi:hypothetical protein
MRNYREEAYIYNVMSDVLDSPEFLLKAMAAAYVRKFDIPVETLVLVRLDDSDGREFFYVTDMEALEDGYIREDEAGAGCHQECNRSAGWWHRFLGGLTSRTRGSGGVRRGSDGGGDGGIGPDCLFPFPK